ncbi:ribonuclease H-like domain-containing protein [Bacillus sp. FJAT-45066]|uniref:ribonuclease H-like domain-containing protein n=1 Tax=Bacillus sp. FJAT-45066 TaxID=2011010 RepID=UPI000BB835E4|nr:ribonuclease H-like domain-containing protein [Bacillus sp. FJAT-45066]
MKLKNKLNRLKTHMKHESVPVESTVKEVNKQPEQIDIPYKEQWQEFQTRVYNYEEQHCLIREVEYPLEYKHGNYKLGELVHIVEKWNQSVNEHPLSSKGHLATDLFFFDTETTGLSGGAGTTIFLLGYAKIEKDKVVVRQHFLPQPGNEIALYQSFLEKVDYTTLVTYNGKAFDWPQVKTRHTLIKEHVPKLPSFGHFDLLHASRRFWKNELEAVRLSIVEKEKLAIYREHDTPGFLAPMLYFDFLKTQNPEGIKGILIHNEIDVLSLINLYIHLSNLLLTEAETMTKEEKYEVARWFDSLGDKETAASVYEEVKDESWKACFKLGLLKKKNKEMDLAESYFTQAFHDNLNDRKYEAGIELAKHYEHTHKNMEKALDYSYQSLDLCKEINDPFKSEKLVKDIEKRIQRLLKKKQGK